MRDSGAGGVLLAACLLAVCACDAVPVGSPAIPELKHRGFRKDVLDTDRGNAVFDDVWWSDDGGTLVTLHHLSPKLRVWDAADGRLLSSFRATPTEEGLLVDGTRGRLVARAFGTGGVGDRSRLVVFDLRTGEEISSIPDDAERPAVALGLVRDGEAIALARPGAIEVWSLDPPALVRSSPSPLPVDRYRPGCSGIFSAYHDKRCWELSADGRRLALSETRPGVAREIRVHLVDLETSAVEEIPLPERARRSSLTASAFSPDGRRLAVGTGEGVEMYDLDSKTWGPFLAGTHKRNKLLGAMTFSADGRRLVTLGDQLQTSVFDVESGELLGRWAPSFEEREGVFRVSRDGSRVVVYHFVSDTLEVLDGGDARPLGWVCPFFCNVKHNPVVVPYALSPDGKRVVASHRYGAGIWEVDTDRWIASLHDPELPPVKER